MQKRDSQRKKVFASVEDLAKAVTAPLPDMYDNVHPFVHKVLTKATIKRRYGSTVDPVRISIRDGRGYGWATGSTAEGGFITVPKCERDTVHVLRALAYVIAGRQRRFGSGSRSEELGDTLKARNGWEYCAVLMDLVRYGLGESEGDTLKAIFDKRKVKWTKPTVRILSSAQKQAAVLKGQALAAQNKDRKQREAFVAEFPDAKLADRDSFTDPYWETLYRTWR